VSRLLVFFLTIFTLAASNAGAGQFWVNLELVSEPLMTAPHDLILTPDGRYLVVAAMGNNRVVLLDPDQLTLQGVIGEHILSYPHDVIFDAQGRLLVADSGNDRIVVYTLEDTQARLIDIIDGLDGPEGLAVGPQGRLYVAATMEGRVVRLRDGVIEASTDSALGMPLDRPHDIKILQDATGLSVIATDPGNHRLAVFAHTLRPT